MNQEEKVLYSIVYINYSYEEIKKEVLNYVKNGIKVLWFTEDEAKVANKFKEWIKNGLLFVYIVNSSVPKTLIIDGKMTESQNINLLRAIECDDRFNLEQYLIEHADIKSNMIVEAGAGTGKTTVMVNRIMYLKHVYPDLSFSDISMITFTNEATSSMKQKLRKQIQTRYNATKNNKYLKMLEDVSQIRINTIHSFCKNMICELGSSLGYSADIKLRGFIYEKRKIIMDLLNEYIKGKDESVKDSIGLFTYQIENLVLEYWEQLENLGLSEEDIKNLDWGKCTEDEKSKNIQETLKYIFNQLETKYSEVKKEFDAISMKDIIRELDKIIEEDQNAITRIRPFRFLFVDEFQDSDNLQIKTIGKIASTLKIQLFVVGDIKQSIYRFRGATDSAFSKIIHELVEVYGMDKPKIYTLRKNYRTSKDILDPLNPIFEKWSKKKLLNYDGALIAQNKEEGEIRIYSAINNFERKKIAIREIKESLDKIKPGEQFVVLSRTNNQLDTVLRWCKEIKVACKIKQRGTFFQSLPVRDLCNMLGAFIYDKEPVYLFNFCYTSFYPRIISISEFEDMNGDKDKLLNWFNNNLFDDKWKYYLKEFRLKPAMAVIREIIQDDKFDPVRIYANKRRWQLKNEKFQEDALNEQLYIDVMQYKANLDKLMQIIRDDFSGEFSSVYEIYDYLKLKIATDKSEDEAESETNSKSIKCVYGLTVHASKGLEFDTVMIPFMDKEYRNDERSEILLDDNYEKIGWKYFTGEQYCNDNYDDFLKTEIDSETQEETRLLYVAMTRAIRKLVCIEMGEKEHSWANLLKGESNVKDNSNLYQFR